MSEAPPDAGSADGAGTVGVDTTTAVVEQTDAVDVLVAAWRRERPDLDVAPLEVLSRVSRLARHLDRARSAAFARHDLETWEFDVLAALRRSGPPYRLTPGQLLARTMVSSGTMTNRIDRLAGRGLVRREPDPTDGRGVLVALEESGRQVADEALADLLQMEDGVLADVSSLDRRRLASLLRAVLLPLEPGGPASP